MDHPKIYNTYFLAMIATVGGNGVSIYNHLNHTSLTYEQFCFDISSMSAIVCTKQYMEYFDNRHGIIQGSLWISTRGRQCRPIADGWAKL
jgi:hypothetical protein